MVWSLLLGCADHDPVETAVTTDTAGESCASLGWDNFGAPFLTVWCTACHTSAATGADRFGAPDGVDFDTLDGARAWSERIRIRAVDSTDMPLGGYGPSDVARAELGEWIACGMPQ